MSSTITDRSAIPVAEPQVVSARGEVLWFLGTLARVKLEGRQTGGRFALWEGVLPPGAAPPLHSHPQDETFYILEGELTAWLVEPELADDGSEPPAWVTTSRTSFISTSSSVLPKDSLLACRPASVISSAARPHPPGTYGGNRGLRELATVGVLVRRMGS